MTSNGSTSLSQLPNPEEFDEKVFQPPESSAYVFIRIEDWKSLFIKNLSHSATSVTTSQSKSINKAIPTDHFGDGTSRVFAKASLCFREAWYILVQIRFVSRGGCAQRMLERGEEDSFPLHHGRRRRGGCDFWSHASSAQQQF